MKDEEKKNATKLDRTPSENDFLIKDDHADVLSDTGEEEFAMGGGL